MRQQRTSLSSRQGGYSLAEILVAMAIFTVVVLAALLLYDRSNKTFKQSMESADMQQNTRVAFGKLVSDLRLTGFDFDRDGIPFGSIAPLWKTATSYVPGNRVQPDPPNGHTYVCVTGGTSNAVAAWDDTDGAIVTENDGTPVWQEVQTLQYQQADEQIEYVGAAAITIRGNFNYETSNAQCPPPGDPAEPCENGREMDLESAAIQLVTTRNSEVVTYALVSNSGDPDANKGEILFYADVKDTRHVYPGSAEPEEDEVKITGVDLTNQYPPYTLHRYTLNDDGTVAAGVAIADNIRALRLRYFTDTAGTSANEIATADLPNGDGPYDADNPDDATPERDDRANVKSIRIELVGMAPNADPSYTHPTDTVAPRYRQYALETLIVPRNLGRRGMKEFSTEAPGKPTLQTVCFGSCNAIYAAWDPPPPSGVGSGGEVDTYNIVYQEGPCGVNPTYVHAEDAGNNLEGYASLFVVPGKQYRVSVEAVNKFGAATADECLEVTVLNSTKPKLPTDLIATGGGIAGYDAIANQIDLYWTPTTENAETATSCVPSGSKTELKIPGQERIFYQIWRSTEKDFDPDDVDTTDEEKILDYSTSPQPALIGGLMKYTDRTAGNCLPYYYRIQTIDSCFRPPAAGKNKDGDSTLAKSGVFPPIGTDAIPGEATTAQTPAKPVNLSISAQDPSPPSGLTDVTFTWAPVTTDDATPAVAMNVSSYRVDATKLSDSSVTSVVAPTTQGTLNDLDAGESYEVTVTAVDCNESAASDPVTWPCTWKGGNASVAPSQEYGGAGTAVSPWIIESSTTLDVTFVLGTENVGKVQFTTYAPDDTLIDGPITDNGPKTSFSYSIPNPPDGVVARINIAATSLDGKCTLSRNVYVLDAAPPPCELLDDQTDGAVVTFTSGSANVNVTLKNSSATDAHILQKVIVTWDTGIAASGTKLDSITVPKGVGTVNGAPSPSCGKSMVTADFTTLGPDVIAANTTTYPITITFSKTQTNLVVTGVCIVYQSDTGDIKRCTIYPTAGTCTEPAAACQN